MGKYEKYVHDHSRIITHINLQLGKCAKFQPYNLLLTKVMTKKQGNKMTIARTVQTVGNLPAKWFDLVDSGLSPYLET
jgi:uncharacterized membrane protein